MRDLAIYAASIGNLTDARYFAAWGTQWLGFQMEPGAENYLPPNQVQAMIEWVDGITPTGEFGLQTAEEIQTAVQLLNLQAVKLGHFTDLGVLDALGNVQVLKEWVIGPGTSLQSIYQQADDLAGRIAYHILDFTKTGISYSAFSISPDFEVLEQLCESQACLLHFDWTPASLEAALESFQPAGIVLQGGAEEKVGFKSFDELDELLEVVD